MKTLKICLIASSGGHLEQILMLKPLSEKYDCFLVTEKTKYNSKTGFDRVYYLSQINRRELYFPFLLLKNIFLSFKLFLKEKPDVIITTGVLAVIPMCLIGKITKKKLIYIESFAKINTPTLTGKLMYHFADRFYVQWEPMLEVYPKAVFLGGIY